MTRCKEECEALMSSVLPVAERMLLERRAVRPFGSTLSVADQITQIGGWNAGPEPVSAELISEFERSFRDGAARGELKATALVEPVSVVPPGKTEPEHAVSIRLDHRDDYSIVVTFPYRFPAGGELEFDDPFAVPGKNETFPR
jgi:hypothetical protein